MMLVTYILGQHFYPVEYPVRRLILVSLVVVGFVTVASMFLPLIGLAWIAVSIVSLVAVVAFIGFVERADVVPAFAKIKLRLSRRK